MTGRLSLKDSVCKKRINFVYTASNLKTFQNISCGRKHQLISCHLFTYEGHLESKERFAIQR